MTTYISYCIWNVIHNWSKGYVERYEIKRKESYKEQVYLPCWTPVYVSHFFHSPDSLYYSMVPHSDKVVTTATTSGWSSSVTDCIDITELSAVLKYIWFGFPTHTRYDLWNSLLEVNSWETCCLVLIQSCSIRNFLNISVSGYNKIYIFLRLWYSFICKKKWQRG